MAADCVNGGTPAAAITIVPRTSDKRQRLLKAGRKLIHNKGFSRTTLADIAQASGVPLGNVYYYFQTKDDLLEAVISAQDDDFRKRASTFERNASPRDRLLAYLDSVIASRKSITQHGCPVGSLAQELNKVTPASRRMRTNQGLLQRAGWAAEQFRAMGRSDADELGTWFVGSVQGAILMAQTMGDSGVIERLIGQLKAWIEAF